MHLDFTFFADTVYTSVYNKELMQFYRSATPIRIMLVDCIANTDNFKLDHKFPCVDGSVVDHYRLADIRPLEQLLAPLSSYPLVL